MAFAATTYCRPFDPHASARGSLATADHDQASVQVGGGAFYVSAFGYRPRHKVRGALRLPTPQLGPRAHEALNTVSRCHSRDSWRIRRVRDMDWRRRSRPGTGPAAAEPPVTLQDRPAGPVIAVSRWGQPDGHRGRGPVVRPRPKIRDILRRGPLAPT
jgi:hypothetical protein